jgi:formyltetrahydrofolate synthetase
MLDRVVVSGALAVLMMDALPPNTMQTLEGTPALVHETWLKFGAVVRLN